MGFKVDTSFLRYLTMGARGTRQVITELRDLGFEPIELERYSTSNKIWATKIKRLRLPDLLCVRTGLKVEVRAKSKLTIQMSHAPGNAERIWDADADDDDLVAFIACREGPHGRALADKAAYFAIGSLRRSIGATKPIGAKSGAEGSERGIAWPATVPNKSGTVLAVTSSLLTVINDGAKSQYSYQMKGRHPYVRPGDRFKAGTTFLAGAPDRMANLQLYLKQRYDPLRLLRSARPTDRYAAVKAIRFRPDCQGAADALLSRMLAREADPRVELEAAATATALGLTAGQDRVAKFVWESPDTELSMEAILILAEVRGSFARAELIRAAGDTVVLGDERRQAAIWGLGKAGVKAYDELLRYLGDPEEQVALHAIAAFGTDTPTPVVNKLTSMLASNDPRLAPAASEALRTIGGKRVVAALVALSTQDETGRNWALATLGRLDPALVRRELAGSTLLAEITPMLLMAQGGNWLTQEDTFGDFSFLAKQNL